MTSPDLEELAESFAARRSRLQRLIVVRLATLRQIMQRSANLAFGRATGLNGFEWLLVSFIGFHPGSVISEVADRLLRDKGQVSRAVARLTDIGLVARKHVRAPLELTEKGAELYRRIEAVLRARNDALLDGFDAEERRLLSAILDKLFLGANALLERERGLAEDRAGGAAADGAAADRNKGGASPVARPAQGGASWRSSGRADPGSPDWLVMPDLHVLLSLLRQSASMAHGRVTGLARFDWQTLTHVEVGGPVMLSDLIASLDRNKSQVGRAVAHLVDLGLVQRRREPGAPSIVVSTTPAGRAAFDLIMEEALRRDSVLIEELTIREYRALIAILDRLTHNALGLLAREREIEDAEARAAPSAIER